MSSNVGQNNQAEIAARPAPAVERYQQRRARIMELKRQRQQEDRQFASDFTRNLESQEYNQNFPNPAERMKIRIS